jgi:hypothetical protein
VNTVGTTRWYGVGSFQFSCVETVARRTFSTDADGNVAAAPFPSNGGLPTGIDHATDLRLDGVVVTYGDLMRSTLRLRPNASSGILAGTEVGTVLLIACASNDGAGGGQRGGSGGVSRAISGAGAAGTRKED